MSDNRKILSAAKSGGCALKSVNSAAVILPSATPQENRSGSDSKTKSKKHAELFNLPAELQTREDAVLGPRIIELESKMEEIPRHYEDVEVMIRHDFQQIVNEPLLSTCHDSRDETKFRNHHMLIRDSGSRETHFFPDKDIIYSSGSDSYLRHRGFEWQCDVDFKAAIQHLAIDMFLYTTRLPTTRSVPDQVVAEFPNLQSLTLVHDYRLVATKYRQQAQTQLVLHGNDQIFVLPVPSVRGDHADIVQQFLSLTPNFNIAFKSYKGHKDSSGCMILEDCVFGELEPPNTLELDRYGALVNANGPVGRNILRA